MPISTPRPTRPEIIASTPGVRPVTYAVIAGPYRFHSLAAIWALSPNLSQSGQAEHQHELTNVGDPLLQETLFTAADQTRKTEQQLAGKYKLLITTERHHDSAICQIAIILFIRIATCWRTDQHNIFRIVRMHYTVDKKTRINATAKRHSRCQKGRTDREQQKSPSTSIHQTVTPA
ncbi:hypothetical protein JK2ML_0678 [Mycobacterium leprae Kyoto-2]|uniref:Transposase IS116/IS110/IS902 C-terminal domain-containing protein n=3 Tax=Mycobacterium leprae TaxID=1769 RepID=Q7AQG2_MYCLE|nr:transposase [Mycobacterium leprae]CAR70772.1 hypothetical protein MLBr00678 [Mycobacterium leprae Br4923]AWV47514.1 hypothetical protein DIJ64_03690 [Mycobacterium leprae]OAR21708.1 hypothetical protein A8144_00395 [Mycobacterium leprae 3125609]OAX72246.1 hypothetical protein A3216_00455 [Mycobacterium leprae 7935681]CAB10995.1 hypothetical protein MLCB1779.14 [Mycobacterium leprae]